MKRDAAQEHLDRLKAQQPERSAGHDAWLDYRNGAAGFEYATVEFGPEQLRSEVALRSQGYEPAPLEDAVLFPARGGMLRVHPPATPSKPGEYQAWRVPLAWLEELRRREERARSKHSLRGHSLTFEDQLAEAEARVARLRSMGS